METQAEYKITKKTIPRLLQPKTEYIVEYPQAIAFTKLQNSVIWFSEEFKLEKDIQDIKVNMTEAESHGVLEVLKLFTQYELSVGNEYWGDKVGKMFKRPEIQRMASCFSFFELNIHAPFYNKINELLMINTPEFYNSYKKDKTLAARMKFIDECLEDDDPLFSLGTFAMVEGAVLYTSFAFLKHFQTNR